jgi:integrase/recombinase XerD
MDNHFERFIRERIYEKNITKKTEEAHRQAYTSFRKTCQLESVQELDKAAIIDWLEALHKTSIRPTSINCYARSLNAFFRWLMENGYITEKLKIKKLATPIEVVKTLPEENLKALLSYKPTFFGEKRVQAIVLTLLDTGIRINEAFGLKTGDLDLDNERFKIYGKGRKERIVPFSPELRRILMRFLDSKELSKLPNDRYVFCTRMGRKLLYDNLRKDYANLCSSLGIKKMGGFHRLRHTFATNFLKGGGNVLFLKNILGHTELRTTQIYVHPDSDDLKEAHSRSSIFAKFKK